MSDFREQRIEALRAKLKAREGKPGFKANVELIKQQIAALEARGSFRSTETGQFVSTEHFTQNPETSVPVEASE